MSTPDGTLRIKIELDVVPYGEYEDGAINEKALVSLQYYGWTTDSNYSEDTISKTFNEMVTLAQENLK